MPINSIVYFGRWMLGFSAKLIGLMLITFILFHLGETDPARLKLGAMASEEAVMRERDAMGLNDSLPSQFIDFMGDAVRGDLGNSFRYGKPALGLAWSKFETTFLIVFGGLIPALFLSYGFALAVYRWPAFADFVLLPVRSLAILPSFVAAVGGLLLLSLGGFPLATGDNLGVACFLIALFPTASLTLLLHRATSSGLKTRTWYFSRSLGMSELASFHRGLFRPASFPWLTAWVTLLSQALFTALILELVLTIDGAGALLATSVQQRDLPVLRAVVLINGLIFLCLHAAIRALGPRIDPRIGHG